MKLKLGQYASYATLLFLAKFFNLPEPLQFAMLLIFFSPIWISIIRFFLTVAKNNRNAVIPTIVTYAIAIGYYFYNYGIDTFTIVYILIGMSLTMLVILLYEDTFKYLENEGVRSYRRKALYSFATATTFGAISLALIKLLLQTGI